MQTRAICAVVICAFNGQLACAQSDERALHDELRLLRERMGTLEQQHADDQRRIGDLEKQLSEVRAEHENPWLAEQRTHEMRRLVQDVLNDADRTMNMTQAGASGGWGQGNLFNPQITAFLDMGASISTNGDNEALNRFNLREAELDIRDAITPFADGVLILAIHEEIEEEDGGIAVDTAFELEEGYINFHTLPYDLQLKAGKFRNAFGRNNLLHTHDLPQITRPLAVQAFFGHEGLATVGASTNWLVANPWDKFVELTVEVVNADGGEEAPILGGPNADNPALLAHLKFFEDVGATGSFEIGGSYLYAHTSDESEFDANVFGLDVMYKRLDPEAPDFRSLLLQSEFFWASNDIAESDFVAGPFRNDSFGMYAFAQYQFDLNWYTGVRFDYTDFPNSEIFGPSDAQWDVSPYVTWYLTEFLRLRFEYQHLESEMGGDWDNEDNFLLGLTFSIGSHPPHPYWVNR
jgi:hypothetical protein